MQKYQLPSDRFMRAVLIGTGRIAQVLGGTLHARGIKFIGVHGRNKARAVDFALRLESQAIDDLKSVPRYADLYLLAVSDDALAEVSAQLGAVDGLVVHMSGTVPADALASDHKRIGVLYPLQTFSEHRAVQLNEVPIFIQAQSPDDLAILHRLASLLSQTVIPTHDEIRKQLHLSAVFACNFVNALYDMSAGLLESHGLNFNLLHPLIRETALKATSMSPTLAQTGPARRADMKAIAKHLTMLENNPREKTVYNVITAYLLEKYHNITL